MTDRNAFARHRILLIDDNRAIHQDFRKIFGGSPNTESLDAVEADIFGSAAVSSQRNPFRIDSAYQGQEGLVLVQKAQADGDPYAMAFVDVRMPPGWNGIETIARIWEVDADLQVVVCTAYSDYSWDEMHEKLGRSDRLVILKKPFDNVEVLQLAEALTVKWSLLQQTRQHLQELESTIAKRTEQLRKSEEHFRLIAENVTDLIAIVDPQGRRIYNSPSYERLLGYSPDELQTSLAFTQIHPEDRAGVIAAARELIEAGASNVLEYRMRHKDGSWRTLESHGAPFRTATGQIEGVLTVARDVTERKRAAESLSASEQMLRLVLDTIPVRVFWKNRALAYLGCNRLFAQDAGFDSPADLVGKLDTELVWHEQAEQYRSDDRQFIELGQARLHYEEIQTRPDGRTSVLRTSKIPLRDHCGSIIGILGLYEDITERKQAELATLRLAAIVESSDDAIIGKDLNNVITSWNRGAEKIFGYAATEMVGTSILQLIPADRHEEEQLIFAKLKRGESVEHFETLRQTKAGRIINIAVTVSAIKDAAGQVIGMSKVARDITGRKKAEEQLRESQRLLQSTLDALSAHIAILNEAGCIIAVNAMWQNFATANDFMGWGSGVGLNYLQVCDAATGDCADEALAVAAGIRAVMANQQTGFHLEYPCHSPAEQRWFEVRATRFAGTGPLRVVIAHENITERVKAEHDRKNIEIQLRQAQKLESIGQLAAGVAHEINTPTQYIGDNTQFLRESFQELVPVLSAPRQLLEAVRNNCVTPELLLATEQALEKADVDYLVAEIPKAIEQSLQGVERVAKIVRAMKEFSHPGTADKTKVDLNHCIDSTLTVARNEWKYVADLVTEFDPELPLVTCLPGEFNQVILNLVVNAAHTIGDTMKDGRGSKGTITVTTRRAGDWAEVRIRDTGTGIPESARAKIFEPFFTTKAVGKGTGQGLAIARSVIVDKHGGTITFDTELGKGTVFIIRLPLTTALEKKDTP